MKLLHCAAGKTYGGVEVFLRTLAENPFGMRHEFALCFQERLFFELKKIGLPVHSLGESRFRFPWSVWSFRHRLKTLVRARSYDGVIFHGTWIWAMAGPSAIHFKCPTLWWLHECFDPNHWLDKRAGRFFPTRVVANSHYVNQSFRSQTQESSVSSSVIYCPLRRSAARGSSREEIRKRMGACERTTVLIQVSRIVPLKGIHSNIRALRSMKAKKTQLWILGEAQSGTDKRYVRKLRLLAKECGVEDRVHFLGYCENVTDYLASADIFTQPNESPEAFGLSLLEALCTGLPVVTSDFGGAKEIVTSQCGRLVAAGSVSDLASTLDELTANTALRRRLAAQARLRACQVAGIEKFWKDFHAILGECGVGIRGQRKHNFQKKTPPTQARIGGVHIEFPLKWPTGNEG